MAEQYHAVAAPSFQVLLALQSLVPVLKSSRHFRDSRFELFDKGFQVVSVPDVKRVLRNIPPPIFSSLKKGNGKVIPVLN
jgi:hypothetical protein